MFGSFIIIMLKCNPLKTLYHHKYTGGGLATGIHVITFLGLANHKKIDENY